MKFGGIVASALAGGLAGYGRGEAAAGQMEMQDIMQKQRDELLAQKQERLQKLSQEFQSAQADKQFTASYGLQSSAQDFAAGQSKEAQAHAERMQAGTIEAQKTIAQMQISAAKGNHEETLALQKQLAEMADKHQWHVGKDGAYLHNDGTPVVGPTQHVEGRAIPGQPIMAPDYMKTGRSFNEDARSELGAERDLSARIKALEDKDYLNPDQKTQLAGLKKEYDALRLKNSAGASTAKGAVAGAQSGFDPTQPWAGVNGTPRWMPQ